MVMNRSTSSANRETRNSWLFSLGPVISLYSLRAVASGSMLTAYKSEESEQSCLKPFEIKMGKLEAPDSLRVAVGKAYNAFIAVKKGP